MNDRVLMVDDDKRLLAGYKRRYRKIFDIETAEGAGQGLLMVKNQGPYAVIISDLRMPGMDGIRFLSKVRELSPDSIRIMLTGYADRENAFDALNKASANRILVKPCKDDTIEKAITEGIQQYRSVVGGKTQSSPPETKAHQKKESTLEEVIAVLKGDEIDLPSLPQIAVKFKEISKKGADFDDIANLLKQDMAIASKIIRISNSAFYRGVEQNKTVEQAIGRLGLVATEQLVDAICNKALYTIANKKYMPVIEKLWEHSLSCAHACQIIFELLDQHLEVDPFTLGLFHDIGKLILLRIIAELEKKGKFKRELDIIESFDVLANYHDVFGAKLLEKWEFSTIYVHCAMYHDSLEKADSVTNELLIVHFANLLVKTIGYDITEKRPVIELKDVESARRLGLNFSMIEKITNDVVDRIEDLKESLI